MIARHWRGIVKQECAEDYIRHLQLSTFPTLERLAGFRGAQILRRNIDAGVEFCIVTTWESLDSIRSFSGEGLTKAVVPAEARAMMLDFDREVRHYEINFSLNKEKS